MQVRRYNTFVKIFFKKLNLLILSVWLSCIALLYMLLTIFQEQWCIGNVRKYAKELSYLYLIATQKCKLSVTGLGVEHLIHMKMKVLLFFLKRITNPIEHYFRKALENNKKALTFVKASLSL